MSEISSTVRIHDGMSPALKSMNKAIEMSDVILTKINYLANNEQVQAFAFGIVNVLSFITGAILEVFDLLGIIASFIYENWSLIAPVIFYRRRSNVVVLGGNEWICNGSGIP